MVPGSDKPHRNDSILRTALSIPPNFPAQILTLPKCSPRVVLLHFLQLWILRSCI
jgi:hypothetical protein